MKISIAPNIYYVGVNDWDRQMFDALVPLPLGTSYNSYVIKGSEKTAVVDTVEPCKWEEYFGRLNALEIETVDYIISDHSEQDHSGLICKLLEIYPKAKIVTNSKCKDLLKAFLGVHEDKFVEVTNGDTLSLGDKNLEFILAPWVHWPDTMFTYVKEDKLLFTTDFFGAHIADSSVFVDNEARVYDAAKRYYAQIMMPYRTNVVTNLKKVEELDVEIIAPSHGQVYDNPGFIIDAYREWSSDSVSNTVVIPFVSMHGSTQKMVEFLTDALIERNIKVKPYNLDVADSGELAMALVDAATIIIGTPAVLVGAHPKAVYGAYLANVLRPKAKFLSVVGSYGWGCRVEESITKLMNNVKAEVIDPVIIKGYPTEKDFDSLLILAENIKEKHLELGLM